MRKADLRAFADFMADEAVKYSRDLTKPEIETWFENFPRTKLEDFKAAWIEHKRDPKGGQFFPKIVDLQRILRTTGDGQAERDWRCTVEVGAERCGYPGGIIPQGGRAMCSPHYRLSGSTDYTDAKALQIIEASREYVPPKTAMEMMERGVLIRAATGKRWSDNAAREQAERRAKIEEVERITREVGSDPQAVAELAARAIAEQKAKQAPVTENAEVDVNALAALAASEERA